MFSEYSEHFNNLWPLIKTVKHMVEDEGETLNVILFRNNELETGRLRYRLDGQVESPYKEYYENFRILEPEYNRTWPRVKDPKYFDPILVFRKFVPKLDKQQRKRKQKPVNHDPYNKYARMDAPRSTEDMKPGELDTWTRYLENLQHTRAHDI